MVETTEDGYIDVSDDETYEAFDDYLAEGQQLAMDIEEGLHDARQLATQVRDGEMTMDEYDESEVVLRVRDRLRQFEAWNSEYPDLDG
jgi:hypothetical protein